MHENAIIWVQKKKNVSGDITAKNRHQPKADWKPSIFCLGTGMTRSRYLVRVGWYFRIWLH